MEYQKQLKACIYLLAFSLLLCSLPSYSHSSKLGDIKHDLSFKKYSETYMPGVDWRLLKAQCFQESLFDVHAVSPVGAKGICQFMPGTWREEAARLGIIGGPFDYKLNIQVAASYMSRLRAQWYSERPEEDRHSLAMASYNAGLGHILRSQRLCDGNKLYDEIMICLPCVTGHHSRETNTYVFRIWGFYERLLKL